MAWLPTLQDSYCFQRYEAEPGFQALLRHVEDRQMAIREKLPSTLEVFGVSLDSSPPE